MTREIALETVERAVAPIEVLLFTRQARKVSSFEHGGRQERAVSRTRSTYICVNPLFRFGETAFLGILIQVFLSLLLQCIAEAAAW